MGVPSWLSEYAVLGTTHQHVCFHIEDQIYAYWIAGRLRRQNLDDLTELITGAPGWRKPYVSIAFAEDITGYDPDLRSVMTDPGDLATVAADLAIVVSERPLQRMVIRTMAIAARAAGYPGGRISAASTFEEALDDARAALASHQQRRPA